jgi:pimeloyl-ACP methyl ester carboxylesterase
MPTLHHDGATIAYDLYGPEDGYPVLLFAPGGLRSRVEMWRDPPGGPPRPWNDWTRVLAEKYRVVAMDQRNAGRSVGPIRAGDGWHIYAADQLALMDHLGYTRFHTLGGCIGSSFCLKLNAMVPQRISAAVLQNPIGLHPEHPTHFDDSFRDWAKEQRTARSDLDAAALEAFGRTMWKDGFVFSVGRDFARRCTVPCLVLPGDDTPHPAVIGEELARLLPGAERLHPWKGPAHLAEQRRRVTEFLARHTLKRGV